MKKPKGSGRRWAHEYLNIAIWKVESTEMQKEGYLHIYYGEGIGLAPTILGMALRSCGAGLNTGYFRLHGEDNRDVQKSLYDIDSDIFSDILAGVRFQDYYDTSSYIDTVTKELNNYDMIILEMGRPLSLEVLENILAARSGSVEILLCGASFPKELLNAADLISRVDYID